MKKVTIKLHLIEELLGTASANPDLHKDYVASKAPDAPSMEEEVAALGVEEVSGKMTTIFPRENGNPFLFDYQIKGFFKDACGSLARVPGTKSNKLKAYRKIIDGTIFVSPRKILIHLAADGSPGTCQRPLRINGPQGERVALACSETIPAESLLEFEVTLFDEGHLALLKEWLDYGQFRGLGQWRNSGKGRFTYTLS